MSDAELLLVPVLLPKFDRRSISAFGMRGIDGAATTGGEDARDDEWVRLAEMEEGDGNSELSLVFASEAEGAVLATDFTTDAEGTVFATDAGGTVFAIDAEGVLLGDFTNFDEEVSREDVEELDAEVEVGSLVAMETASRPRLPS